MSAPATVLKLRRGVRTSIRSARSRWSCTASFGVRFQVCSGLMSISAVRVFWVAGGESSKPRLGLATGASKTQPRPPKLVRTGSRTYCFQPSRRLGTAKRLADQLRRALTVGGGNIEMRAGPTILRAQRTDQHALVFQQALHIARGAERGID